MTQLKNIQAFVAWLKTADEYKYIVDGANVAYNRQVPSPAPPRPCPGPYLINFLGPYLVYLAKERCPALPS